jgi:hypothetical protein
MQRFWNLKLSFDAEDILPFLGVGDCFGYFLKKLGEFFSQSSGHCVGLVHFTP